MAILVHSSFLGSRIGMVGVLHTWTRDLSYHPYVHYLVPAGALASCQKGFSGARQAPLHPVPGQVPG
jgi:hypothetical protein